MSLPDLKQRREATIAAYGDKRRFLTLFNPDRQTELCRNEEQCFFGDYPTLGLLNSTYGAQTAAIWLVPQLSDLSEYCGCKDKLTDRSLEQCAELIAERYYWLKVTELMLFFKHFKLGDYGRFYGSVDPLVIMSALKTFIVERSNAIDRKEQKEHEAERERWEMERTRSVRIEDSETYKLLKQKLNIM